MTGDMPRLYGSIAAFITGAGKRAAHIDTSAAMRYNIPYERVHAAFRIV
jgi:hypothetical protein